MMIISVQMEGLVVAVTTVTTSASYNSLYSPVEGLSHSLLHPRPSLYTSKEEVPICEINAVTALQIKQR